jgi:hypothetical protein
MARNVQHVIEKRHAGGQSARPLPLEISPDVTICVSFVLR